MAWLLTLEILNMHRQMLIFVYLNNGMAANT